LLFLAVFTRPARADLTSEFVRSLDWLIDSSDLVVVVEVGQRGGKTFANTEAVLKGPAQPGLAGWPPADLAGIVAGLPRGRRLLVFARAGRGRALDVRGLVCLSKGPRLKGRSLEDARYVAVTGPMAERARQGVCAALTKTGEVLTEPDQVLRLVRARLARGSRVPADCDRDRVELPYSGDEYGGTYHCTNTPWDTNNVIHHVLVPWEPEYEKALLDELRRARGAAKAAVARQLANYRTAETAAALKACLADDFVMKAVVNGSPRACYPVREAAAESLRRIGHVPGPEPRPGARRKRGR
jgi:hypothetical protein